MGTDANCRNDPIVQMVKPRTGRAAYDGLRVRERIVWRTAPKESQVVMANWSFIMWAPKEASSLDLMIVGSTVVGSGW